MQSDRTIFHIDMDSFFATVEQQANPYLRGKPIVVSGKEGSRTVIVASSVEAKRLGIKTGMLPFEAIALFKDVIFVEPDGVKYENCSRQIMSIFQRFTDKVEIFSIDEAFLDMSGHCKNTEQAICSVDKIKAQIKTEVGEWVTCSVGIAKNKLLSKLASKMKKPNGLFFIDEHNLDSILESIELDDFCGIGRGIKRHLNELGIDNIIKLRQYPEIRLEAEFGSFYGKKLYLMARGVDDTPVISYLYQPEIKSIGRAHTLDKSTFDKNEMLTILLNLCEKVGRELRRKNLAGKTIMIYWRYDDFTHDGIRKSLAGYTNSTLELFELANKKINTFVFPQPVRLVGVRVGNLVAGYQQGSLWLEDRKKQNLIPALDQVNDKFGEFTIKPTYLLKLKKMRNKVGGFKLQDFD